MSLIPTIYSSTDSGAPAITGQAGSLVALLDAILVVGYGTGINARPPLGWTAPFSVGDKRVYRNSIANGTGGWLRIDDAMPLYASVSAASAASDIDTLVDQYPTAAQGGPTAWPKSTAASSTARAWWAIGNESAFYLFIDSNGGGIASAQTLHFAGDILRANPADAWTFAVSEYGRSTYTGGTDSPRLLSAQSLEVTITAASVVLNAQRAFTGVAGDVGGRLHVVGGGVIQQNYFGWQGNGSGGLAFPDPCTGGLVYSPILVHAGFNGIRGRLPGCFNPLHNGVINDGQVLEGINGMPPGSRLVSKVTRLGAGSQFPRVLFETSLPWQ